MADNGQSSMDTMLGRVVVERGLATAQEVQKCIDQQRQALIDSDPNQRSLGELLVHNSYLTQPQLDRLRMEMEEQRTTRQIPGYEMLERLGAGAMATVYKARQLSLDRLVAIKVLPKKYTNNPQFVQRFYAEGKAAAKLNHPNIVGALDVGKTGDTHFFVMEYVKGKSVYEELVDTGRYTEERAIQIAIDIASALDHAHNAGFIHRDVKPKNIMITDDGIAKLADMGLARAVSDVEAAQAEQGKAFGTPYYISPEQIRGDATVDARADLYSLGSTVYHMVTGQVPFDGPNPSAVMHKHLKSDLVPPDHINPDLTQGVAEIIEVLMAKDRDKRYATAADLLDDLRLVQKGEAPVQARKMIDISSFTSLAKSGDTQDLVALPRDEPLTGQPIFWIGLLGWTLALIVLVVLIVVLLTGQTG
jgi:serine/threonine-protein kinase